MVSGGAEGWPPADISLAVGNPAMAGLTYPPWEPVTKLRF